MVTNLVSMPHVSPPGYLRSEEELSTFPERRQTCKYQVDLLQMEFFTSKLVVPNLSIIIGWLIIKVNQVISYSTGTGIAPQLPPTAQSMADGRGSRYYRLTPAFFPPTIPSHRFQVTHHPFLVTLLLRRSK